MTTMLYFPGEHLNAQDPFFDRRLLVRLRGGAEIIASRKARHGLALPHVTVTTDFVRCIHDHHAL